MLYVYPLLCSPTVDKRVYPAISKVLEEYILLNLLTKQTITGLATNIGKTAVKTAGIPLKMEAKDDDFSVPIPSITEIRPVAFPPSVSLQPTFVQVKTTFGVTLLGVKVVPFQLNKPEDVIKWTQLKANQFRSLSKRFTSFIKRWVMKFLYRNPISLTVRKLIKGAPLTGNLDKDVLYGTSKFSRRLSLMVSIEEVEKYPKLVDPSNIFYLAKVGWQTIVVVDQVDKYMMVCIPKYETWYRIPFSYIFGSLKQKDAYSDISDLRTGTSIFSMRKMNLRTGAAKILSGAKIAKYK